MYIIKILSYLEVKLSYLSDMTLHYKLELTEYLKYENGEFCLAVFINIHFLFVQ